jgi:hypothetical protein
VATFNNVKPRDYCCASCQVCLTSGSEGAGSGQHCVFPFKYKGVEYSQCTNADKSTGNWCSIQTDSSGNHVAGQWGNCGAYCPEELPLSHGCYFKQDGGNGNCGELTTWTPDRWGKEHADSWSSEAKCLARKKPNDAFCGTDGLWFYVDALERFGTPENYGSPGDKVRTGRPVFFRSTSAGAHIGATPSGTFDVTEVGHESRHQFNIKVEDLLPKGWFHRWFNYFKLKANKGKMIIAGDKIKIKSVTGGYLNVKGTEVNRKEKKISDHFKKKKKSGKGLPQDDKVFVIEGVDKVHRDQHGSMSIQAVVRFGDVVRLKAGTGKYLETRNGKLTATGSSTSDSTLFILESSDGKGGLYSTDLPEKGPIGTREQTLHQLGICAAATYNANFDEDKLHPRDGWYPTLSQLEYRGSQHDVQAGAFQHQRYPGVAVIAFRGTQSWKSVKQDLSMAYHGPVNACNDALRFFHRAKAHPKFSAVKTFYVAGTSLGGYFAEFVASKENVPGVSFNAPGILNGYHTTDPGWYRPPFESHLAREDPIASTLYSDITRANLARPRVWEGKCHCESGPFFSLCGGFHGLETCEERIARGGSRYT